MLDLEERENYRKVVELGPRAHSGLIAILSKETNAVVVSRIMGIFVESSGDKSAAIRTICACLATNDHWRTSVKIKTVAAEVLSKIGTSADCDCLYPLTADDNERVRVTSLRAISKIGDRDCGIWVEKSLNSRLKQLDVVEAASDATLKEGQTCLQILKERPVRLK